ncbi:WD40 repeat-like protein [Amniculicola lignicola CBS 123094]|uniref:WD40 repeat-like protein n=1 Tax=Amniculicola lignicola CBS 123094 TaxID=1392246 RepID=A0A6A5WHY0_9PLEO|nr:WD40 repeat-like protein [Amniculicola lignicola CBS 123094]
MPYIRHEQAKEKDSPDVDVVSRPQHQGFVEAEQQIQVGQLDRRHSILSLRPKTSSAVDESSTQRRSEPDMKRTASQTFHTHANHDGREGAALGLRSVKEHSGTLDFASSTPSAPSTAAHTSSFSRASQVVVVSCKSLCRRLSSSGSRRPSLSTATFEAPSRKASVTPPPSRLEHKDSGVPPTLHDVSPPLTLGLHSKFSLRRFGSLRRRPATSGPSGDFARYNPIPPGIPISYPSSGGHAARASVAAYNQRLSMARQEQETASFLEGDLLASPIDEDMRDNESGVGMMCSSPIERTDSVQGKRMGMGTATRQLITTCANTITDPLKILPAELGTIILQNLDAPALQNAERVSKMWREAASSPHVWKTVFLREFQPEVHVSPEPITMGGAGVGKFKEGKPEPGQDWKQMFKVRKTIERRWRGCTPSAIYLNGHSDSVYCCQFDEDKIITGSRDRTIRVWDMKTYTCRKVIGGPSNRPAPNTPPRLEVHKQTVVNNPSLNGTEKGDDIYYVPEDFHEASILCLQYDDKIMVTGSSDHTCIVWDITTDDYKPMYRLRAHTAGVLDVCLDEKHIISCSKDATINVWDRATGDHLRTLTGHRGPVNAVQLRGNLLVSASGDGVAKLWNLDQGHCIKEFPSQDRGLAAVEFSDDAKFVLAGGNDHVVYKFDALTGALLHTSSRHGGLVRSLFLDAVNGRVVSGSYDQSIRVADYHTGDVFGLYENWTTSWILSAKSDYRRVVATSQDGRALVLDFGWGVEGKEGVVGC